MSGSYSTHHPQHLLPAATRPLHLCTRPPPRTSSLLANLHEFPCIAAGRDEYSLVEALKAGRITKPVVAWVRCAVGAVASPTAGPPSCRTVLAGGANQICCAVGTA